MVGIDLHTGKLKWRRKFIAEDLAYTTVSDDGRQYYLVHTSGSKETVLYEIDCMTGESINELQVELDDKTKKKFSSSVYSDVTDTHFWGVTSLGLLYAINLATGAMDWRYELKGALTGSPFFICNNRLYIVTHTEQFIFEGAGGYIVD